MSILGQKKFLVTFSIPLATMTNWAKTDADIRAVAEKEMSAAWDKWSAEHANMLLTTEVAGKTKNVTANVVEDTRNDFVICSTVSGESHEAVANTFKDHPHLGIPTASIQIMELKAMTW